MFSIPKANPRFSGGTTMDTIGNPATPTTVNKELKSGKRKRIRAFTKRRKIPINIME